MAPPWERPLARWAEAGLVDTAGVERIRAWESAHGGTTKLRWPAQLALGLGVPAGATARVQAGDRSAQLTEPVAYFIPEHAADPSVRPAGEELWAEVSIPRRGPPRPIRLGVWRDGRLTPLDLR